MLRKLSVAIAVLSILTESSLFGQGKDVKVMLRNSLMIEGELLAVREQSLLLSSLAGATDDQLQSSNRFLVEVSTIAIQSVALKREGGSHAVLGALVGGTIGGGIGYIASRPSENETGFQESFRESLAPLGIATCIVLGTGLGALIGALTKGDKVVEASSTDPNFMALKAYARYPFDEPEFLRSCVPRRVREQ